MTANQQDAYTICPSCFMTAVNKSLYNSNSRYCFPRRDGCRLELSDYRYDQITKEFHYVIVQDSHTDRLSCKKIPIIGYDEAVVRKLYVLKDDFIKWREETFESIEERCNKEIDKLLKSCSRWNVLRNNYGYSISEISLKRQPYIFSNYGSPDDSVRKMIGEMNEKINPIWEKYRNDYTKAFNDQFNTYIQKVEGVKTGITKLKPKDSKYCTDFRESREKAVLQYPQSTSEHIVCLDKVQVYEYIPKDAAFLDEIQIVDNIQMYYHSQLLKEFYDWADARSDEIVGYSHRIRGWAGNRRFTLDSREKMFFELKPNFGYGRKSYFFQILSLRGIKILDYTASIYYCGIGATELLNYTRMFDRTESSFKCCFDDVEAKYNEYKEVGAESFLVRHTKKSIEKLTELMVVIATGNMFIQIKDLELFNDLTSAGTRKLVLDPELVIAGYNFNPEEERILDEFVTSLEIESNGQIRIPFAGQLSEGLPKLFSVHSDGDDLYQACFLESVRNKLKELVHARFPKVGTDNINAVLMKAVQLGVATPYTVKTYEGYELIEFRIHKACAVIKMLPNIKSLLGIVDVNVSYGQLIDLCMTIGEQAKDFLENDIEPKIAKEKKGLDSEMCAYEAYINKHKLKDEEKIESFKHSINEAKKRLSKLDNQKREIEQYLKKVALLS